MKKRVILRFKRNTIDKPIVYHLVKDFNLIYNILRANVSPRAESMMVMEIEGDEADFQKGMEFLQGWNIGVEPIGQDIVRNEEKCVHCGACIAFCSTEALHFDKGSLKVLFDAEKCNGCEFCVTACPVRAMEVDLF